MLAPTIGIPGHLLTRSSVQNMNTCLFKCAVEYVSYLIILVIYWLPFVIAHILTLFIPTLDTTTKFVIMTIWLSQNLRLRGDN